MEEELISTGHLKTIDLETGLKTPNTQIEINTGWKLPFKMLEISYSDINGKVHGPFIFDKKKLRTEFLLFFKKLKLKEMQKKNRFIYSETRRSETEKCFDNLDRLAPKLIHIGTSLNIAHCLMKATKYKINNSEYKNIPSVCEIKDIWKDAIDVNSLYCYTKSCKKNRDIKTKVGDKMVIQVTFFDGTESPELKYTVPDPNQNRGHRCDDKPGTFYKILWQDFSNKQFDMFLKELKKAPGYSSHKILSAPQEKWWELLYKSTSSAPDIKKLILESLKETGIDSEYIDIEIRPSGTEIIVENYNVD